MAPIDSWIKYIGWMSRIRFQSRKTLLSGNRSLRPLSTTGDAYDLASAARSRGGVAYHKLGSDRNFGSVLHPFFNSVEQGTCCNLAYLSEWLTHRRETWGVICGNLNIVEAYHRNIFRNS